MARRGLVQRFLKDAVILLACLSLQTWGFAQSNSVSVQAGETTAPRKGLPKSLDQIDPGAISGSVYSNPELGFSYEFPSNWHVVDNARYKKRIEAGHEGSFGDDPAAAREHESAWACTRTLLWVLRDPEGSETDNNRTTPIIFAGAVNPGCFEGHKFPISLADRAAVQDFANTIAASLAGPPFVDDKQKTKAYESQGHVILEISRAADIDVAEGRKPVRIYATFRLTSVRDYWIFWILSADSESNLASLRNLKTTFSVTRAGPAAK